MKAIKIIGIASLALVSLSVCFWLGYLLGPRPLAAPAAEASTDGLRIISAVFGSGTKFVDVTDRMNDLVEQPSAEFVARADWLQADPTPGWNKALVITYEWKGERLTFVAGAGGKVSLELLKSRASSTKAPTTAPKPARAAAEPAIREAYLAAGKDGNVTRLAEILDRHPEFLNQPSGNSSAMLLHTAVVNNRADVVAELLRRKAEVNARNKWGFTPLIDWVPKGTDEIGLLLLTNGADVAATNNSGKTALQSALDKGLSKKAELLRQHGAKE